MFSLPLPPQPASMKHSEVPTAYLHYHQNTQQCQCNSNSKQINKLPFTWRINPYSSAIHHTNDKICEINKFAILNFATRTYILIEIKIDSRLE